MHGEGVDGHLQAVAFAVSGQVGGVEFVGLVIDDVPGAWGGFAGGGLEDEVDFASEVRLAYSDGEIQLAIEVLGGGNLRARGFSRKRASIRRKSSESLGISSQRLRPMSAAAWWMSLAGSWGGRNREAPCNGGGACRRVAGSRRGGVWGSPPFGGLLGHGRDAVPPAPCHS